MFLSVIHSPPEDEPMKDRSTLGLYEVRVRNNVFSSVANSWAKAVQWWNEYLEVVIYCKVQIPTKYVIRSAHIDNFIRQN